jgi:Domain of unknown function (DUF4123)
MLSQKEISLEELSQVADEGCLYAVVDACGCHDLVMNKAYSECGPSKAVCLFKDTYMESYDAVAPYLFSADRPLLEWIRNILDKESWGIFIASKAELEELKVHLQRFLLAALPDHRKWFFRYYDPRVLPFYLATCNDAELWHFFGPIRGFAVSDSKQSKTIVFAHSYPPEHGSTAVCFHPSGLWLVRPEQFNALGNLAAEQFSQKVIAHAQECFPDLCSLMDQKVLRDYVQNGIRRAASYGITIERQVCQYIDFVFAFGINFDREVWASKVLDDKAIRSPLQKLERLYQAVLAIEGATHGEK